MTVRVKRIYEPVGADDGLRVLVDRVWPQRISRYDARIDLWEREVAPSLELRRWFGHAPERWPEFARRYRAELKASQALETLRRLTRQAPVTLLHGARDPARNHALVLRAVLDARTRRKEASAP